MELKKSQTRKALTLALSAIYREHIAAICKRPPPEAQAWGVLRTQAWLKVATDGHRIMRRERFNLTRASSVIARMNLVLTASLTELAEAHASNSSR